jgi:uncharacterized protein (TIGR02117 family)
MWRNIPSTTGQCRSWHPLALLLALLAACVSPPRRPPALQALPSGPAAGSAALATIYLVKQRWHTGVGFAAKDLEPPLASMRMAFPGARYLLFGFGDRHYLLSRHQGIGVLLAALWPGPGVILVTGVTTSLQESFGSHNVARLGVGLAQARELERFVRRSLAPAGGAPALLAPGPYGASLYYASTQRYSALHTCNTWTAEALRAASLPVSSTGVEFAGQVWAQVRRLARRHAARPQGPASTRGAPRSLSAVAVALHAKTRMLM